MNNKAIVAIDYSCIKYKTYYGGHKTWDANIHGFKTEVLNYWAKEIANNFKQIAEAVTSDCGDPNPTVIGLVDSQPYWRTKVFAHQQQARRDQGLEPLCYKIKSQAVPDYEYKGNRPSKNSYSEFLRLVDGLMWALPYKVFKAPGAEADDLFGAFSEAVKIDSRLRLYGASLDKDWTLCCANEQTRFLNLHHKKWLEIISHEQALSSFQKEYKGIVAMADVPDAKSRKGERSDNLPKGFDPRLADLVNYSLPEREKFSDLEGFTGTWDFCDINRDIAKLVLDLSLLADLDR